MLKEVFPGIFVDSIRTGWTEVKQLNLGFIPASPRSLLIDAGMPENMSPPCLEALLRDVEELGIRWQDLDCIITHGHRDHVGLAHILNEKGARVFINPVDMQRDATPEFVFMDPERKEALYKKLGLRMSDPEIYDRFWASGDDFVRGFEHCWDFSWEPMNPGETVSYGDFTFELIPLPGHTKGQMGLLEKEKRVLFSGDQLIHGIVSIVWDTGTYDNALNDFFESMRAIKHRYADCLIIPGHGDPFRGPAANIDRVLDNYTGKMQIMHECLKKSEKPLCVWGVARRVYGQYGREISPEMQRAFILIWLKTYACLEFLKKRGLVKFEINEDGVPMWTAV